MPKNIFQVIEGRKQPPEWKDRQSELTLGELVNFQEFLRCVILQISDIRASRNTCPWIDVLTEIERQLGTVLAPFGLLFPEVAQQPLITYRLLNHVCRIPPTRENHEMLKGFFARLLDREREMGRPHIVRPKPGTSAKRGS